jgi:hypothetical protein
MVSPHMVPDSKPPVLLLSLGASLVAGLIIRTLRRRQQRAATARGVEVSSTGKRVRQPASRSKAHKRPLLVASTGTAERVTSSQAKVCEQS